MHKTLKYLLCFYLLVFSALATQAQEICDNGIDDNGNGLIDLNDPECDCAGISSFLTTSIIPNPSFEMRSCCPSNFGDMDCVVTWTQGSSGAALDYIHQCGLMADDFLRPPLPFPDGEGCIAYVANLQNVDFQEYVAACLNRPMEADTSYTLNFHLGFGIQTTVSPTYNLDTVFSADTAEVAIFGNVSCDQLPYPGDRCPTSFPGSEWELINTIEVVGSEEWVETAFEFTPDKTYRSIAIGAPCGRKDLGNGAEYYFVDNLILSESRNFELEAPLKSGSECVNSVELRSPVIMSDIEYQWYVDGVAIVGATSSTLDLTGDDMSGSYQVKLSQGSNCQTSMSIELIDNPNLTASIDGDTELCPGETSELKATGGFVGYRWSDGSRDSVLEVSASGTYSVIVTDENGCTLEVSETVTLSTPIAANSSITDAAGTNDNGSIILNPTGGVSPYQYTWNTGASSKDLSGLSDGTYTVTLTDDFGCEQEFSFDVKFNPDPFGARISLEHINCHDAADGVIEIEGFGGRKPYTIAWSDGSDEFLRTQLAPGRYVYTLTDSDGETDTEEIILTEPAPLTFTPKISQPSCYGFSDGRIDFDISGGTANYTTFINGSELNHGTATNIPAGSYDFEIRDGNGCELNSNVDVEEPDSLSVNIAYEAPNCFGYEDGRIEIISIRGGTRPYAAQVNGEEADITGLRQIGSGDYELVITDRNQCLWVENILLPEPEQVEIEVQAYDQELIKGQSVDLEARQFPQDLVGTEGEWYSDTYDPQIECISCLETQARPKSTTTFSYQLWYKDCLFSDEVTVEVTDWSVYVPNIFTPNGDGTNDRFSFSGNDESGIFIRELSIFNRWGQIVHQVKNIGHNSYSGWDGQFKGEDVPQGVYIYHLILEDGRGENYNLSGDISIVR